jgi:hypothetical protein
MIFSSKLEFSPTKSARMLFRPTQFISLIHALKSGTTVMLVMLLDIKSSYLGVNLGRGVADG